MAQTWVFKTLLNYHLLATEQTDVACRLNSACTIGELRLHPIRHVNGIITQRLRHEGTEIPQMRFKDGIKKPAFVISDTRPNILPACTERCLFQKHRE